MPCPEEPCCPNDCGVLVWFDGLWLRPNRGNPVAFTQAGLGVTTSTSLIGYDSAHDFAWRVGGGFLTEDNWLFTASYTQYKDLVAAQVFNSPGGNGDVAITVGYVGPGQLLGATLALPGTLLTSWNLQYHTIDTFAGGVFSPTCYLDLVVGGGVRIASIDQDFRTTIGQADTTTSEILGLNMQGAGPRLGGEARVYIFPWWNLYGRGFGSVLLAHRDDDSVRLDTLADGSIDSLSTVTYSREEIIPMVELAAGTDFTLLCGRLQLGFGYEFHYWWEMSSSTPEIRSQPQIFTHNPLSLDGFYARVMVLW
jgi:hypothetical protein